MSAVPLPLPSASTHASLRVSGLERSSSSPKNVKARSETTTSKRNPSSLRKQKKTPNKPKTPKGGDIAQAALPLTIRRRARSNNIAKQLIFNSQEEAQSQDSSGEESASSSSTPDSDIANQLRKDLKQAKREDEIITEINMTCPEHLKKASVVRKLEHSGSLANERVFVAISDVCESPILGLFANVDFKRGDVVTCYGGRLRSSNDAHQEEEDHKTHVRRIPGSIFVRDGLEFSRYFKRDSVSEMKSELDLPASARVHREVTGCERDVWERIQQEGVGYMANTDEKSKLNVKVKSLKPTNSGVYPEILTYVATRDIKQYEEILAPYNNNESVQMQRDRKKKKKQTVQTKLPFGFVKTVKTCI
jgi:transposase-like protein